MSISWKSSWRIEKSGFMIFKQGMLSARLNHVKTGQVLEPSSARLKEAEPLIGQSSFIAPDDMEEQLQLSGQLDGYGLFVYGVVLRRLHLPELAIPALCEAVRLKPAHWGAWLELSCLVKSRDRLTGLDLPDHWCKQVFLAHTYLELQQNEQAVKIYDGLSAAGLGESTYIMAQVGTVS